jgi:hypothetical protein
MDESNGKPERANEPVLTTVLIRLGIFQLILVASHGLLLWLRPMGPHNFFWNLAFGGKIFLGCHARLGCSPPTRF